MRRLAWIAAFVLGLLAIAGAAWSAFGPEKIVLTEPQLQLACGLIRKGNVRNASIVSCRGNSAA